MDNDEKECWNCKYEYDLLTCQECIYEPVLMQNRRDNFKTKETQITPQKAGELWEGNGMEFYTHANRPLHSDRVSVTYRAGGRHKLPKNIVHCQDGWIRVRPTVENESIERIEIEGVQWKEDCNLWIRPCGKTMKKSLEQLVGKPQMKMILEIPKEENE